MTIQVALRTENMGKLQAEITLSRNLEIDFTRVNALNGDTGTLMAHFLRRKLSRRMMLMMKICSSISENRIEALRSPPRV